MTKISAETKEQGRNLLRQGVAAPEVAERMGVTVSVARGWLHGLRLRREVPPTEEHRLPPADAIRDRALALLRAGKSHREVAGALGLPVSTVSTWHRKLLP